MSHSPDPAALLALAERLEENAAAIDETERDFPISWKGAGVIGRAIFHGVRTSNREAAATLRALAAAQETGWQDIATAPMNRKTQMMLWSPEMGLGGIMVGTLAEHENGPISAPFIPCRWTHWRPLPTPPSTHERRP